MQPLIYSIISKSFIDQAVVACLQITNDSRADAVQVQVGTEVKLISKPFGSAYEIGGLQLDQEGHRLAIVSKDACYIYLYVIIDLTD